MLFDFFKKKPPDAPPAPTAAVPTAEAPTAEWDLSLLTSQISLLAPALETRDIEAELIRARLADHYRDLQLEPVQAQHFDTMVAELDAEGWRRLALAVGILDHGDIRSALALRVATAPVTQQVYVGFVEMAKRTDALTLAMIRQSDVRAEEFARHFAAYLGVGWRGETEQQSEQRLSQIDYKRLLAEADEAKKLAEERMVYLRKKQEEDSARRRPRGKQ